MIYQFDAHQSLKMLYSTGFNSPNPTQTSIVLPGDVMGNNDLTAEIVKTFDIAYSYTRDNLLFVANVYSMSAEDFIVRRYSEPDNANSFFNEGNFDRSGAELDLQIASEHSKVFANLAYQKQGDSVYIDDPHAINIPKITISVGANTTLADIHNLGASISYIGERNTLDAYSVVNVNYTLNISNFDFFINIRNLFDEEILNPDNTTAYSTLVAQGEKGTNAQFGVRVHF